MVEYGLKKELWEKDGIFVKTSLIVLPKPLQQRALNLVHKNHLGIVRAKQLLRDKDFWPTMSAM